MDGNVRISHVTDQSLLNMVNNTKLIWDVLEKILEQMKRQTAVLERLDVIKREGGSL